MITRRLTRFPGAGRALIARTLVIVIALIGLGEIILRVPAVTERLPAPSLGSNHEEFEVKLHLLDQWAGDGPVDCVLIGSSMVNNGIDPAALESAYREQTGESLRCFNLGLPGLTASAAAMVGEYVIDTYRPRLLIYGLSPRDFSPAAVAVGFSARDLDDLAWMRAQNGEWSLNGWLLTHAATVRYTRVLIPWLYPDGVYQVNDRQALDDLLDRHAGYHPETGVLRDSGDTRRADRLDDLFADFAPVPAEWDGLAAILALHDSASPQSIPQIVLYEAPLHPAILGDYLDPARYDRFNRQVHDLAAAAGVVYWPTTRLDLVPADGWMNLNHVNHSGALVMSRWLAGQLAAHAH